LPPDPRHRRLVLSLLMLRPVGQQP